MLHVGMLPDQSWGSAVTNSIVKPRNSRRPFLRTCEPFGMNSSLFHALQGYELAKRATLEFLETFKVPVEPLDREALTCVARTALRTKLHQSLADQLTDIVVDAVLVINKPEQPIDLFMVRSRVVECKVWAANACALHAWGARKQSSVYHKHVRLTDKEDLC